MSACIGSGMIVASLAAATIMPSYGWRGLTIVGGVLPLLIALPMPWVLIEMQAVSSAEPAPWLVMFEREIVLMTVIVTLALFATYLVTFCLSFWLPSLVTPVAGTSAGSG